MANGRMLNKSISTSKKVADLIEAVGPYGGLFWTWMIPHLDREGRIHGDPDVLKGMVAPRLAGITPAIIRQTAAKAHELGLIVWYEAGGDNFISFPGFSHNQPNMRKDREPESSIPAPTSDVCRQVAGNVPAELRQSAGSVTAEEKRREVEEKRREENDLSSSKQLDVVDSTTGKIRLVFDHYRKHHPKSHPSPKPKTKEWVKITQRLTEGYSVEDLCLAIDGCHVTPHNMGDNDRNQQYLGLELIMRDGSQVTRFMENAQKHGHRPNLNRFSSKEQKNIKATQQWLQGEQHEPV